MSIDSSIGPFGQVFKKLCMFKPCESKEPIPGHCYARALSWDITPFKLPYLLAHTFDWGVLSILECACHKLRIAYGLTFVIHSLHGWESSLTPRTFAHTRIIWALTPTAQRIPGVTLGSPLCPWCFKHIIWRGAQQAGASQQSGLNRNMFQSKERKKFGPLYQHKKQTEGKNPDKGGT